MLPLTERKRFQHHIVQMVIAIDLSWQRFLSFHGYNHGLFQVNPGKLFNSIKCVSQLKGLTINSQPDRESDQTCSNKYDLTGDIFNSFSGSFSFVFHCMLAACQCLTVPADSDLEALYHDP